MNIRDELLTAAKEGDIAKLKTLITDSSLANTRDDRGFSLICWAAEGGKTDAVVLLHQMGADINDAQNDNKSTPLHCAANKGRVDTIAKLLNLNANIDLTNKWGTTPLFLAMDSEQYDAAEFLISNGARLDIPDDEGETLLCAAINSDNEDIVKQLLDKKINVNEKNRSGKSPLHIAVENGQVNLVTLLLSAQANIEEKDNLGNTPLQIAIIEKDIAMIKFLLGKDADVNATNNKLDTPLHLAVANGQANLVTLLLSAQANIEKKDNLGNTPLQIAIIKKDIAMIKLLLEKGADVNATNNKLDTPLHLAVATGNPDILKLILNAKPKLNEQNKYGLTPLHNSVVQDKAIIDLLLTAGADVNIVDDKKHTALYLALMLNEQESIKLLSPLSPEINCDDFKQRRELSIVVNNGELNSLLQRKHPINFEGGYSSEFYRLVRPKLEKFISLNKDKLEGKLDACLDRFKKYNYFRSLKPSGLIAELEKEKTIPFTKGYDSHGIPFLIQKLPNDTYQLTMIDRGAFAEYLPKEQNKVYTARILSPIPKEKMEEILSLIEEAHSSDREKAKEILFDKIPKAVPGLKYTYDDKMIQKPFKRGQCYFENHKSLLMCEFISAYGEKKGRRLYKEFDLFLHQELLNDFVRHFENTSKDKEGLYEIKRLCHKIIETKKARLLHRAIRDADPELVKRLMSERVDIKMKDREGRYDAIDTAIFHGNNENLELGDEILKLLQDYKAYLSSIEAAEELARDSTFKVKPDEKVLKSKFFIDNNELKKAQETDPVFFDHYFIKGYIQSAAYIKTLNVKAAITDSIFLKSQSISNLFNLAALYSTGFRVPKDLMTAESLLREALNRIPNEKYGIDPPKEIIEAELRKIQLENTLDKPTKLTNDPYFNKWDNKRSLIENVIKILDDYTSWSLTGWKNANTKEIKGLISILQTSAFTDEELRLFLLKKRFEFLQNGVPADNNLFKMLNFTIQQFNLQPKIGTLSFPNQNQYIKS